MGNRRLKNRSYTEHRKHKRREKKNLFKKQSKSRTIPREIPTGYFEIDKAITNYIRQYLKHINPRQVLSTIEPSTTLPAFKRQVIVYMNRQNELGSTIKLSIPSINYLDDTILLIPSVTGGITAATTFKCPFSNPLFFQKLLTFLDHINIYYWCKNVILYKLLFDCINESDEPILQRLIRAININHNLDEIELGKIKIGCNSIIIRDGSVLTNGLVVATLDQAVLDQHTVANKIKRVLIYG